MPSNNLPEYYYYKNSDILVTVIFKDKHKNECVYFFSNNQENKHALLSDFDAWVQDGTFVPVPAKLINKSAFAKFVDYLKTLVK
jgi:hypothetical protein